MRRGLSGPPCTKVGDTGLLGELQWREPGKVSSCPRHAARASALLLRNAERQAPGPGGQDWLSVLVTPTHATPTGQDPGLGGGPTTKGSRLPGLQH